MAESLLCQLRREMSKINKDLYKKTLTFGKGSQLRNIHNLKVLYRFEIYLEGSLEPFKSSSNGVIDVNNGVEPPFGYYMALATMRDKEESIFWISHNILSLHEKSDAIFKVRITSVKKSVQNGPQNNFQLKFQQAVNMRAEAFKHYNEKNFKCSIKILINWFKELEEATTANFSQELKKRICQTKLLQDLALCYIKTSEPRNCLEVIKEYEKIKSIDENSKVLYAKAKALKMIEDRDENLSILWAQEATSLKITSLDAKNLSFESPKASLINSSSASNFEVIASELLKTQSASTFPSQPSKSTQTCDTSSGYSTISQHQNNNFKNNFVKVEKNPISELQERCAAKKCRLPIYSEDVIGKFPHKVFIITCKVIMYRNMYETKGFGKSKKLAKHDAAEKMLEFLKFGTSFK